MVIDKTEIRCRELKAARRVRTSANCGINTSWTGGADGLAFTIAMVLVDFAATTLSKFELAMNEQE